MENINNIQDNLDILADAISDTGYWFYAKVDLPEKLDLQFAAIQLYLKPDSENSAPYDRIALEFLKPKSILLLAKEPEKLNINIFSDLANQNDKAIQMDFENCSFDKSRVKEIYSTAKASYSFFGEEVSDKTIDDSEIGFAFYAGDIGVLILSKELKIHTIYGEVPIEKIEILANSWWEYWKKYWEYKGTDKELPYDFTCELSLPIK